MTVPSSEVTSFPRGRGKGQVEEKAKVAISSDSNLFQDDVVKTSKKRSKMSEDGEPRKKSKTQTNDKISAFKLKDLVPGYRCLAVVKEIHDLDLLVSLPGGVNGHISIADISEPISQVVSRVTEGDDEDVNLPSLESLFQSGQWVQCIVTKVEEVKDGEKYKRKIIASLHPKLINEGLSNKDVCSGMVLPASVNSIEDHGFILDFGIDGLNGFINKKSSKGYDGNLTVGAVVQAHVMSTEARLATCALDPKSFSNPLSEKTGTHTLATLRPGALVTAKIKSVGESGLMLTLFGFFDVPCTTNQLDKRYVGDNLSQWLQETYKPGQKVKARLFTWISREDGIQIRVSLQSHVIDFKRDVPWKDLDVGDVVKVNVVRMDDYGVLVAKDDYFGYIFLSRLSDKKMDKVPKKYAVGTTHEARVVGFDMIDQLVHLSCQESIMQLPFLRIVDMKPGQLVRCEILKILPQGLQVGVTETLRGLVPLLHLSDIRLKNPEKMFKVGQKIPCQVLSVDTHNRKAFFTHKKTLLNSPYPPLTSYESARLGDMHHGVITNVGPKGLLVTFYNNVKGWVPIGETSEEFVDTLSHSFNVGQVVRCRILQVDAEAERMRLSLKGGTNQVSDDFVGQLVTAKVEAKTLDTLQCKSDEEELTISQWHLSDTLEMSQRLFSKTKVGTNLENTLVLSFNGDNVTATRKPLLVEAFGKGQVPSSFNDVEPNSIVVGWVKNVTEQGVFVAFLNDLVGFCRKQNISDEFVQDPRTKIRIGQTVVARVVDVDTAQQRFGLSLKQSSIPDSRMLAAKILQDNFVQTGVDNQDYHVGKQVEGKVKQKAPYGLILELDDKYTGVITTEQTKGKEYKMGQVLKAVVVDGSSDKKIVDLSLDSSLLKTPETKLNDKIKQVKGFVEVAKQDYLIVRIPKYGIGFVPITDVNRTSSIGRLQLGHELKLCPLGYAGKRLVLYVDSPVNKEKVEVSASKTLVEPIDPTVTSMEDFKLGKLIDVKVKSIKSDQVNLYVAKNLRGRIHVSQILDKKEASKFINSPSFHLADACKLKIGDVIKAKVVGLMSSKTHKYLPITHTHSAAQTIIEMSILPEDLNLDDGEISEPRLPSSLDQVEIGQSMVGFVSSVEEQCIWVAVGPMLMGRVVMVDVSNQLDFVKNPSKHFARGQPVACVVIGKDETKGTLDLSIKHASLNGKSNLPVWDQLSKKTIGFVTVGRIVSVDRLKGIMVAISAHLQGRVGLTDISDEYETDPTAEFSRGQYVACCIIGLDVQNRRIDLSLRPSRLNQPGKFVDPEVKSVESLEGSLVRGYVKSVTDAGCFVTLSNSVTGRVKIAEMSDDYVKDWKNIVSVGQLVTAKVVSVNNGKVELTLKKSATLQKSSVLTWQDLVPGKVVRGVVSKVEPFGVFIQVQDSNISGLCHISRLSDGFVKNISKMYSVGDAVKAVVVEVDVAKRRVAFGLKASLVEGGQESESDVEMDESDSSEMEIDSDQVDSDEADSDDSNMDEQLGEVEDDQSFESDMEQSGADDTESEELQGFEESEGLEDSEASKDSETSEDSEEVESQDSDSDVSSNKDPLDISQGFKWNWTGGKQESDQSLEESSDDDGEGKKKLSRKAKSRAKQEREQRIAQREADLLEHNHAPESAEDFERLLLGSPSSSFLWIKYMALQLHMAEVEKARTVAERALKTINYREEQEKLNVWVAYLNLEHTYGTPDSLNKVFERAVQVNEPIAVFRQLVKIYERGDKIEQAEQVHENMMKRFKDVPQVWVDAGIFHLRNGNVEKSRSILKRSLQSLPKHEHIQTIAKFAQMEFKYGEPERGRTIFEGIVTSYPKRLDLWNVWLDKEIQQNDASIVRRMFERVIRLKLSSKKAKFFFKKWLDYEKQHGDKKSVDAVKQKAVEFVQKMTQ